MSSSNKQIESLAHKIFDVGHKVKVKVDKISTENVGKWEQLSKGNHAAWIAIAKWHLKQIK